MNMMFFTVGKQFTAAEIETLLKEAGFREISLVHTYGYYSLVSGGKPWQQGWWWTAATLTADILDSPGFDRHISRHGIRNKAAVVRLLMERGQFLRRRLSRPAKYRLRPQDDTGDRQLALRILF